LVNKKICEISFAFLSNYGYTRGATLTNNEQGSP